MISRPGSLGWPRPEKCVIEKRVFSYGLKQRQLTRNIFRRGRQVDCVGMTKTSFLANTPLRTVTLPSPETRIHNV